MTSLPPQSPTSTNPHTAGQVSPYELGEDTDVQSTAALPPTTLCLGTTLNYTVLALFQAPLRALCTDSHVSSYQTPLQGAWGTDKIGRVPQGAELVTTGGRLARERTL